MTLTSIEDPITRDRYGRPLITPPGGGKPVAYTRCTTFVDALEDKYNLQQWQQRMVITGLVQRPDLLLSAAAHLDDKKKLNDIAKEALEAASAHAKATIGTAIHALTHRLDRGEDIGPVPGDYQRDLDAYVKATAGMRHLEMEVFTVLDELQIGGTPDRIVEFEGGRYIADIKTGSIEYGMGKISQQLAVYAHSMLYDHNTGERKALPGVSGQRGIVIHLPAGTGVCTLHWVNLTAGWEAVQTSKWVRDWRKRKDLSTPIDVFDAAMKNLEDAGLIGDPILAQIQAAPSREALVALFHANEQAWTPEYTTAAAGRQQQLNEGEKA